MDGDSYALARASTAYAAEGFDWRSSWWCPTDADAGVIAMRRWMEKFGGGATVPSLAPGGAAGAGETSLRDTPRDALLERFHQHTAHCAACTAALATTQATARRATALAAVAAGAAVVVAAASAQHAATLAAGAASSGLLATVAARIVALTRGAPLAAAAAALAAAAAAALVARAARWLEQRFLVSAFDRNQHKFA